MKRSSIGRVLVFVLLAASCVALPQTLGANTGVASGFRPTKVTTAVASLSEPLAQMAGAPALAAGEREREWEEAREAEEREHEGEEAENEAENEGGEARPTEGGGGESEERIKRLVTPDGATTADPAIQSSAPTALMPSPLVNFLAIDNDHNPTGSTSIRPPDENADVGPNDIVETVNQSIAVYSKTGALRAGFPKTVNALWANFPSGLVCQNNNDGDPVVLYDQLADRWLVSQFAIPSFPFGPFYQCIAVSQTPDPTGAWNRYQFTYSVNKMNDYPKFGVWPDGYYASFNQFAAGSLNFVGAGVVAYDRTAMLAGTNATSIYFDLESVDPNAGGLLPSDLNGSTPPPVGAPNYFLEMEAGEFGGGFTDELRVWEFHANFPNPGASTMTATAVLNTQSFDPNLCNFAPCVPQPGTGAKLDTLADRLMYRLNYRNFGDHESLVVNHTVDVGNNRAGVRWYEVRDPGGTPTIFQQGTFAPNDGLHRWMASVNMDKFGNIAAGYSVSSTTKSPSVSYAGRLVSDPAGVFSQGETELIAGGGAQTTSDGRWGDYSSMSVDPVDDCTFWYTGEYTSSVTQFGWKTRIGSFKFPACGGGSTPTISINDAQTTEKNTGQASQIVFTLTLSAPSASNVTVKVTPASGTATKGIDFKAKPITLTIPAGATTVKYKVKVPGDNTAEGTETFTVTLSNPTNCTIADGTGVGTIVDND